MISDSWQRRRKKKPQKAAAAAGANRYPVVEFDLPNGINECSLCPKAGRLNYQVVKSK